MQLLRSVVGMLAVALALTTHTIAQQSSCALSKAPDLRGFRLGMTPSEVRRHLDDPSVLDSVMSSNDNGGSVSTQIFGSQLKGESAEGVDQIYLTFINSRLAVIKLTFNGSAGWDNSREFFARISQSLGLPEPAKSSSARGTETGNERYSMECRSFTVTMAYSFGVSPVVTMIDTAAQKIVEQRREKEQDRNTRRINITPGIGLPRRPPN